MKRCLRLTRGEDLLSALRAYVAASGIRAAVPLACVGCVEGWRVRCADGETVLSGAGRAEIVALAGTLSAEGCHLHIALAGEDLAVFGGHLVEGCIVNTTAEIVLETVEGVRFSRAFDPATGYKELVISDDG